MKATYNVSSCEAIYEHLKKCDSDFVPPLSQTVDLAQYSNKLFLNSFRVEAWKESELIGLIAVYLNFDKQSGFITNVSVTPEFKGEGLAQSLMSRCIEYLLAKGISRLELEVKKSNLRAINFYNKNLFEKEKAVESSYYLYRNIRKGDE